ncbi:MAG: YfcC family protein [Cytophagaceae bacterium]|nr:YfcC family protein [Cytophagaceae bacterium]
MNKKWYEYIPHPVVMLFGMIVLGYILTLLVPSGEFERLMVDGKGKVIPGTFHEVEKPQLNPTAIFYAMPQGFKAAIEVIYIIISSGIMFGFMNASGAVENAVGTFVRKLGHNRQTLLIVLMTFIYGMLGVFIGYENNIAMIPIATVLSLAIGGDLVLATGIAIGGVTVGFGLSPFNPYTVGTAHKIAELPLFSGAVLRSVLCFLGLSIMAWYNVRYFNKTIKNPAKSLAYGIKTDGISLSKPISDFRMKSKDYWIVALFFVMLSVMIFGVFELKWYLNEISGLFLMFSLVLVFFLQKNNIEIGELILDSVSKVTPGAFMVGFAATIRIILEQGKVSDTITNALAELLQGLPTYLSALGMVATQSFMNFVIPSGSGQALATLPILIPLGEMLHLTKQTVVLAFQVADGVSNLVNPTFGGLIAMIALCRVPFERWLRFIAPVVGILLVLVIIFVWISVYIHYGPA